MDDMGYDVEDFKEIDPIFGTMDDFDELISEMNKRSDLYSSQLKIFIQCTFYNYLYNHFFFF